MSETKLLVIGGVAAGTKSAAKAKRENPEWQVTVLTRDEHISYAGCGLPYYVSGVIQEEQELLVRLPEDFKIDYDIDVLTHHETTKIFPDQKLVMAKDLRTGEIKEFYFDRLIIATGADPVLPPIPGIDLGNIFTLRKITDGNNIRRLIDGNRVQHAVIMGGGLIGLEVAENLAHRGIKTSVVELANQILPPFDREVALKIHAHLEEKGVRVLTGVKITGFEGDTEGKVTSVITTQGNLPADLVVVSAGIRPNVSLAKDAGISLGPTGAIAVNPYTETNLPGIYAVGDCAEINHQVSDKPAWMPMGSVANKAGRTAGTNAVNGNTAVLPGALGTAIVKVFNMAAGKTGLTEKDAKALGYSIETVLVPTLDKAHYYPGNTPMVVKLVAEKETHRLLGGQAYGEGGIDKVIDILATAISLKAKIDDLSGMDLAYAPPFSSAMGPTILAANVMLNKLSGKFTGVSPLDLAKRMEDGSTIIDVRLPEEFMLYALPNSKNIPLRQLAKEMIAEDRNQDIILVCKVGVRAYNASLKLKHLGFTRVAILDGGVSAYPFELE